MPSFVQSPSEPTKLQKVTIWVAPEQLPPRKIETQIAWIGLIPVGPSITQPAAVPSSDGEYLTYLDTNCRRNQATNGTTRCHRPNCQSCKMVKESASFTSHVTGKEYVFAGTATCQTWNVIYLIECEQCHMQYTYVGQTTSTSAISIFHLSTFLP